MKTFSAFFFGFWSLLFVFGALVQLNDPDPIFWMTIYLIAAFLSIMAAFGRYFVPLLFASALAALLGGLYFFPESVMDWIVQEWNQADLTMKTIRMEEARESFGLLIISAVMSIAGMIGWKKGSMFRKNDS